MTPTSLNTKKQVMQHDAPKTPSCGETPCCPAAGSVLHRLCCPGARVSSFAARAPQQCALSHELSFRQHPTAASHLGGIAYLDLKSENCLIDQQASVTGKQSWYDVCQIRNIRSPAGISQVDRLWHCSPHNQHQIWAFEGHSNTEAASLMQSNAFKQLLLYMASLKLIRGSNLP